MELSKKSEDSRNWVPNENELKQMASQMAAKFKSLSDVISPTTRTTGIYHFGLKIRISEYYQRYSDGVPREPAETRQKEEVD
jgi:hypothetical protein